MRPATGRCSTGGRGRPLALPGGVERALFARRAGRRAGRRRAQARARIDFLRSFRSTRSTTAPGRAKTFCSKSSGATDVASRSCAGWRASRGAVSAEDGSAIQDVGSDRSAAERPARRHARAHRGALERRGPSSTIVAGIVEIRLRGSRPTPGAGRLRRAARRPKRLVRKHAAPLEALSRSVQRCCRARPLETGASGSTALLAERAQVEARARRRAARLTSVAAGGTAEFSGRVTFALGKLR